MMNLYFSPLACSLATRIALYEAGVEAAFTQVDLKTKRLADGSDFLAIAPMGQVPVLRIEDGSFLTENTAVLQHVADRFPDAKLAPTADVERSHLRQWLGFIGTELHKAVFAPLVDLNSPDGAKTYAREKVALRLGIVQDRLSAHDFLLDRFSVADAYLATILNWAATFGVDLKPWPAVRSYHERVLARPAVARALGEELAMYRDEQAKRASA
jgi:glutathione S-transferase